MLLCRRIHRVLTPSSAPVQRLVQGHFYDKTLLRLKSRYVYTATREIVQDVVQNAPIPHLPPDPTAEMLETVLRISRYSVPKAAKKRKSQDESRLVEKTQRGPFEAYEELRAKDSSLAASLPTDVLCRLAEGAAKYGSKLIVDSLSADILDNCLLSAERRARVAASLLCIPWRFANLLDKPKIHSLLTIIHSQDRLSALSPVALGYIVKCVVDAAPSTLDESLLGFVLPHFLKLLGTLQAPQGTKLMSYRPPEPIPTAYSVINALMTLRRNQEALDLFQCLTETGHVPPDTFRHDDISSPQARDFGVIVRSTLARACSHWGWHYRGVGLVAAIVESQESIDHDLGSLIVRLLHSALEWCSPEQLKHCAWLMAQVTDAYHNIIIPDHTVHLFYRRAFHAGDGTSAELFYGRASAPQVREKANYPLPRGPALTWLMSHFVHQKHNVHLARSLANQVVETSEPIPRYDRARFIAHAASHGFATSARALWETYSVGHARGHVVGNAATMIRMVSLFAQRDLRARAKLEMLRHLEQSELVDQDASPKEQQKRSDYSEFAHRVLYTFHDVISPLERADHYDLSALARGYFILGHMPEGLQPFRILLRRKEIPDIHDINIALSALARHSPKAAAQQIRRMLRKGLHPDAVTFGTVMHEAIVHGDLPLVTDLAILAREQGLEELSSKTIADLIRTSVAIGDETDITLRDNLCRAWDIILSTPDSSVVHTPNIGKSCMLASLHIDEPVMAFNFWKRLVKDKAEWSDREQTFQRSLITKMVRRHCRAGKLDVGRGQAMLLELGVKGKI
ncbi:hypothetical protein F5I97DRAFT_1883813 [Phlebopus sp. FC_14]|nr:hypothetical protein F5I97DRAFT_1883813 [Phlebopus sp. FC_14]